MTFNSLQYVAFFGLVWLVVAGLSARWFGRLVARWVTDPDSLAIRLRNGFLLLGSYVFYGAWDYRFLGLLWLSTLLDYTFGRLMGNVGDHPPRRRHAFIVASVLMNLSILGFFKYFGFFANSLEALAQHFGIALSPIVLTVVLPVGVSFYTFQSLSYTIDVYRGQLPPARSLLEFATFIAFFPQLVAGPIERAVTLLPQFRAPTRITREDLSEGLFLAAAGLFKKVVIADNLALISAKAFGLSDPTGLQALVGSYAFAFQIYCDFSGYTDIARGCARCLGFRMMLNFNLPYFARDPSDFWRRWHISLSSWLRDYLYIPLGGNRGGRFRVYRNLMLTMLLGGLWHGAAWTYVAWGALHGGLLCAHRALRPWLALLTPGGPLGKALYAMVSCVVWFHLVCVSWILFRADSLARAGLMLRALPSVSLHDASVQLAALGPVLMPGVLVLLLLGFQLAELRSRDLMACLHGPAPLRSVVYAVGALLFVWVGQYGDSPFIYFQF